MERFHRTDFYIPFLREVHIEKEFLRVEVGWAYYYNLVRPRYGKGREMETPLRVLQQL
ncbi:MAG: hypothetical protein QXI12_03690 [Candidatus Methanomethyliaceae archaeon]